LSRRGLSSFAYPAPRSLNELVKIDLFESETPDRVGEIWRDYHATADTAVGAVLSAADHATVFERAAKCRFFIHPIFREGGHFMMLTEFQDRHFLTTYLEKFKENPTASTPQLTVTVYDELVAEKGLALVRGDIISSIDKTEAARLVNGGDASGLGLGGVLGSYINEELYSHVEAFNLTPQQFDLDAYMKICETRHNVLEAEKAETADKKEEV
jgi:hypothetical protein